MNKPDTRYPVYDLSPQKFENLCYDLLKREYDYDSIELTYGAHDAGLDIFATKGTLHIGIEIKHRYKLHKSEIKTEISKLIRFEHSFQKFIFITSAFVKPEILNEFENDKIKIISREKLFTLLDKYSDITERHFTLLKSKKRSNDSWLKTSSIVIILSLVSIVTQFFAKEESPGLTNKIDNVENTLNNLKGLENDLKDIKEDMIKMELENTRIKEEYAEVQGLEKALQDKKESLKVIFDYEPWYKQLWKYFIGFTLGLFSSIGGTILLEQWRTKRALTK